MTGAIDHPAVCAAIDPKEPNDSCVLDKGQARSGTIGAADGLPARQIARNLVTAGFWWPYRVHRDSLTRSIVGALERCFRPDPKVAIFGSGNCNDVNLIDILPVLDRLCLVDIDTDSVGRGLTRQGVDRDGRIQVHSADLSMPNGFVCHDHDIIVSSAILTQLFESALNYRASSRSSSEELAILMRVREQHLSNLIASLRPGGHSVGLLVCDLVSSLTCKALKTARQSDAANLMADCLEDGNFFSGTNPYGIAAHLSNLGVRYVNIAQPWIWDMGESRRLTTLLTFVSQ